MRAMRFSLALLSLSMSAILPGVISASAADAPRSYVAAPDVYRIVAQDDRTRMVLGTWKPGQRDAWHSHPARAEYLLTDCDLRVYTPEGNYSDRFRQAGFGYLSGPLASHSFENRGSTECRILIVEHEP